MSSETDLKEAWNTYPTLNLIRLVHVEADEFTHRWVVTFEAETTRLGPTELTVDVLGKDPEEALRNGRSAMELTLKELKEAAARWKR